MGLTLVDIMSMPAKSMGMEIRKIRESSWFTLKAAISAKISIEGALAKILMIIWKACCTLVTSVVSLVTIDAVLNLSMDMKS